MNRADFLALLPLLVLAASSVAVMLSIACRRNHALTAGLTLAGLVISFAMIIPAAAAGPRDVTALLRMDQPALFYIGLILASAAAVTVLCYRYIASRERRVEELYLLLLLASFGCGVLVASSHFASFLLGLEILSVSLYAMLAYLKDRKRALEAAVKYLILASASAAFLLFGMALIYAATGTMSFTMMSNDTAGASALLLPGVAMTVTGIGFKLGVAPFHLWTPDVYEGAPAPVAAFVATTSKSAIVALMLRYAYTSGVLRYYGMFLVFAIIAVASMCAGNLLALRQSNLKRILAYSSIAHFGYVLVAFLANTETSVEAVSFYLVSYTVTTLAAFGVVTVMAGSEDDAGGLENYRGLFWRRPALAAVLTAGMLSLAGIPATAGFIGKFYVLSSATNGSAWWLVLIMVLTSVAGLFYYLRVVVTLYSPAPAYVPSLSKLDLGTAAVLLALAMLVVWIGIDPAQLLNLIRSTFTGFI